MTTPSLPEITDAEKEFIGNRPHLSHLLDWIGGYALAAIAADRSRLAADRAATAPDDLPPSPNLLRDFLAIAEEEWGHYPANTNGAKWIVAARAALTSPDRAANSLAAPEGWVLVPKDATNAMCVAGMKRMFDDKAYSCAWEDVFFNAWRAMIAAAPVGVGREAEHSSVDSVERLSPPAAALGQGTDDKCSRGG